MQTAHCHARSYTAEASKPTSTYMMLVLASTPNIQQSISRNKPREKKRKKNAIHPTLHQNGTMTVMPFTRRGSHRFPTHAHIPHCFKDVDTIGRTISVVVTLVMMPEIVLVPVIDLMPAIALMPSPYACDSPYACIALMPLIGLKQS